MNKINIYGTDLTVKEFSGQRVVTFKDIDAVHQRLEGTASRNFRENRKRFIEETDYFSINLTDDEIRRQFEAGINAGRTLTLITESGYLMLVKSFTDDLAWKVQRQLVNCYFRIKDMAALEYEPTRPLTTDDYKEAARTIAKCHNSRLPIVLDLYRKAGLDIGKHFPHHKRVKEIMKILKG